MKFYILSILPYLILISCGSEANFSNPSPKNDLNSVESEQEPSVSNIPEEITDAEAPQTSFEESTKMPEEAEINVEEAMIVEDLDLTEVCGAETEFETITRSVFYPARSDCSFGKNGNLIEKNSHFQAQSDEIQSINVPKDRVLCNLDFRSSEEEVRYDDYFVLSLNDYILIATHSAFVSDIFADPKIEGLYKWNFDKIKGYRWDDDADDLYCLGGESTCVVPKTDRDGPIEVRIAGQELKSLAQAILFRENLNIGLSTIGDNDEGDCSHSDLEFVFEFNFAKVL